ncbi:MAG: NUDIX domain-containing protein [Chloroflexi bacterium]|nr:NUDIX domain-containing protein [Chloroflexota bacterium]
MRKTPRKTKKYRAAGGIVLNDRAEVLLLEREVPRDDTPSHEIRLPKGHIEAGETPEQAALREVGEESGYWDLQIVADLGEDEIRFTFRGRPIQRQEHYYLMRLGRAPRGAPRPSSPDAEEALFQPLWAPDLDTAAAWLSFESEKEFIRRAQQWLATHSNPWQVD